VSQAKSFSISKKIVWEAYERVKANQGAAGVDAESMEVFEQDLKNNLYRIWNRMSSGTYFPPRKYTQCSWILLYLKRWLEAPAQLEDGTLVPRTKGTPQGGVVSPLVANIFLHLAFDDWMRRVQPGVPFERYADDIVAHCGTEVQAQQVLESIRRRLAQCRQPSGPLGHAEIQTPPPPSSSSRTLARRGGRAGAEVVCPLAPLGPTVGGWMMGAV